MRKGSDPFITVWDGLHDMQCDGSNRSEKTSLRVLVVDDERQVVELARSSLSRRSGIGEVLCETSSTDTLSVLADDPAIDCLLCDFRMPGMDGLELATRAREHRPDLPIILFTSTSRQRYADRPALETVDEVVRKDGRPDVYDRLYERIRSTVT